jgi:hypothetical protein
MDMNSPKRTPFRTNQTGSLGTHTRCIGEAEKVLREVGKMWIAVIPKWRAHGHYWIS